MALDPDSVESIRRYARGALLNADALRTVPVPIDQVAEAMRFASPSDLYDLGGVSPRLLERIGQLRSKVLGALDLREHVIYLDRTLPVERQRFHHGHELGHSALPWHLAAYFGDDRFTLDPETEEELEAQASRFGLELLTGVEGFTEQAGQYRLGLGAPLELAEDWALSRTVTMRRYAETHRSACGLLVIGRYTGVGRVRILNTYESPAFRARFGSLRALVDDWLEVDAHELAGAAYHMLLHGAAEPVINGSFTPSGGPRLRFELTSNGYRLFALVFQPARVPLGRRVRPIWTPASATGAH